MERPRFEVLEHCGGTLSRVCDNHATRCSGGGGRGGSQLARLKAILWPRTWRRSCRLPPRAPTAPSPRQTPRRSPGRRAPRPRPPRGGRRHRPSQRPRPPPGWPPRAGPGRRPFPARQVRAGAEGSTAHARARSAGRGRRRVVGCALNRGTKGAARGGLRLPRCRRAHVRTQRIVLPLDKVPSARLNIAGAQRRSARCTRHSATNRVGALCLYRV